MPHVFVETNWVVAYAAPAHHKNPAAVELLTRARAGEFQLHLPALCLTEARHPLMTRCQPRNEANAVRDFLAWAKAGNAAVSEEEDEVVRRVLSMFESRVKAGLGQVGSIFEEIRQDDAVEVFALNDDMLDKAVELSALDVRLNPFDQAVLAALLVRAQELGATGESELSFCELDKDLQPWDKQGRGTQPLKGLYDECGVWVYGDFTLTQPECPEGWPDVPMPPPAQPAD